MWFLNHGEKKASQVEQTHDRTNSDASGKDYEKVVTVNAISDATYPNSEESSDSLNPKHAYVSSTIGDEENHNGGLASNHIFQNKELRDYWMKQYEESDYENRHLIDPDLTWTPAEERRVVLKSDFHALFWAFIMFLALDVDRYNLANAISGNLLGDIHVSTDDYNLGSTLNLVCFLAAEFPSQLISKKVGVDRFLPTQVVLWSLCAICQCRMNNKAGFLVLRCFVGAFEGGFLPEQITWLSYFYTNDEFTVRSALFYIANPLTQAFSSLLAAAIQTLDGRGGWAGWRYIFLIEGLITMAIGLISYKMPATVSKTKKWYRPRGWYTDREVKIMVNRIIRDDPSKGTMNNRQGISLRMLWRAVSDYDMWSLYLSRFLIDIIATPLSRYMPIILKDMHFKPVIINLLMVPYNIAEIFIMIGQSWLARKLKQNGWLLFWSPFWLLIPIVCMRWWPGFLVDHWGSYVLMFVALSYPPSWAITISWSSANSYSVSRRTVSAALMNMFSQAGSIVGSNIFVASDAPRYNRGLETLVGISVAACAMVLITRYYFVGQNHRKEKKWSRMTVEEQVDYIRHSEDEGNKRLDFRFTY